MTEQERRKAYAQHFENTLSHIIVLDLIGFCQAERDPVARCGRQDTLLYIIQSAKEPAPEESA